MKVEERPVEVLESDTQSVRKIKMSFDMNSLPKMMDTMTGLYQDSDMAVIREYLSNAYDSHIAAGQTRPIEVTLPTQFNTEFVIRDYGTGMSIDELDEVFSKYGKSTKTESNDYVGMLGLGCKCGLAYADQFWLIAIKNGKRSEALITRDEDGGSTVDVKNHDVTEEPDGVEFKINVKNILRFNKKVKEFLYYWKPGLALVDGESHDSIYTDESVTWLEDSVLIPERANNFYLGPFNNKNTLIVQGGVPYPVQLNLTFSNHKVVHFAEIGSVDPTPARENLKDNQRTTEYIDAYVHHINSRVKIYATKALESAKDVFEAISIVSLYRHNVGMKFKGVNIPMLRKGMDYSAIYKISQRGGNRAAVSQYGGGLNIPSNKDTRTLFVGNFFAEKYSISYHRRIEAYWKARDIKVGTPYRIYIVPGPLKQPLKEAFECVDWEDVKAWESANSVRVTPKRPKATGSEKYHIWDDATSSFKIERTKSGVKYMIYTPAEGKHIYDPLWVIRTFYKGYVPVKASVNRHDKFLRNNPNSKRYSAPDISKMVNARLGKPELIYIRFNGAYGGFRSSKFLDPEVKKFYEYVEGKGVDMDAVALYREASRYARPRLYGLDEITNPIDEGIYACLKNYYGGVSDKTKLVNALYVYERENKQ